jgi:glycine oxidase
MAAHPDVLIVGGGVIGLTAAYFLARERARVQLIDRGDFGQEASWAGAGILAPGKIESAVSPFDKLRSWSFREYPRLSEELCADTGIDNGFVRCGGLEFTEIESHLHADEWRGQGVPAESLTPEDVQRLEPALAGDVGRALLISEMAQVRNPRHVKALVASCERRGVNFQTGITVQRIVKQGRRAIALQTDRGRLEAGNYLVATGAWTDRLVADLGWQPGIKPIRGQIALVRTERPIVTRILLWGARYLVPRLDGRILVGSTEEDVGFVKDTTVGAINELLALACRLVPALANAAVERTWAGLRPGSPDGLPFIGRLPGCDNLLVAAGHYRSGIQLAPGTARLLTDMILGRPGTLPAEAFRPDRALV